VVKPGPVVVLALAWFAAFSLRSGFVGLGPALPDLTADLALSFAQSSILVSAPTLLMGLMAVPGGNLADRWGPTRVIALGLALVAIGGGLRAVMPAYPLLLLISIVFGAGIGIAQPPLPRLMRTRFPGRLGVTTGVYASGLVSGSIVGAAASGIMLARTAGTHGWRVPVAVWGILAGVTFVVWTLLMRPWRAPAPELGVKRVAASEASANDAWSPWRDRRMWIAAAIFAAQGLVYYLLVAWLPAVYSEAGASPTASAALFAVFNASTLPGILFFPIWSDRLGRRKPPVMLAACLFLIGVLGLLFFPFANPWRWLWPALAGSGVAALFGMSLVLPADIAPRGRTGAAAGMAFAVGYAGSALGPLVAGVVRDATGSFTTTLTLLPIVGVGMILLAVVTPELPSASRRQIEGVRNAKE
jgi:CP family cyanate transporter-like MFS transporter